MKLIRRFFSSKLEASDDLFKNNIEMSVHPYKIGSKKSKQQDKDNEDGLGILLLKEGAVTLARRRKIE